MARWHLDALFLLLNEQPEDHPAKLTNDSTIQESRGRWGLVFGGEGVEAPAASGTAAAQKELRKRKLNTKLLV